MGMERGSLPESVPDALEVAEPRLELLPALDAVTVLEAES